MLRYVIRRLIVSIPTLLIISLAVFGLSKCAPGDPIVEVFGEETIVLLEPQQVAENYRRKAAQLGLNKPLFYFSLTTAAFPDSLWKIYPLDRRDRLSDITAQNGNWTATCNFEAALNESLKTMEALPDSVQQKPYFRLALLELSNQRQLDKIEHKFQIADSLHTRMAVEFIPLKTSMDALRDNTSEVCNNILSSRLNTPAFYWYGTNNQYQYWLSGFLSGNWGLTKKQTPVWKELRPALLATMAVNCLAIFFAYLIAIPLGVEMARNKGRALDRWGQRILVFLKAMPVFWVGSLLVILFCSPIFGPPLIPNPYLDITDAWNVDSESFLSWFSNKLPKFVLPILVMVLFSLAVLAMQMRGGMLETLNLDYVRTARAKGVSEADVHWTHAFRNGLFPIITIFGTVFPALFTGSLVIETLFNFPGMGKKAQSAFLSYDLTTLCAILMIAAFFSIVGNLIADLMYAWADPRVRYGSGE